LHTAISSTRARLTDECSKIGYVGVAQRRGDAKKVLGPRKLKTFDGVTLVKPGGSDDISGEKEIARKEKKFGGEGIYR